VYVLTLANIIIIIILFNSKNANKAVRCVYNWLVTGDWQISADLMVFYIHF